MTSDRRGVEYGRAAVSEDAALAELVDRSPRAAEVFERFGLDYCCGGRSSLREACEKAGVDVAEVTVALSEHSEPAEPPEWRALGIGALVDHIERVHHEYTKKVMQQLSSLFDKVLTAHGERHPELRRIRAVYDELEADISQHLAKEEQVLHPMCRQLETSTTLPQFHCGSLGNPIRVMEFEHERAGKLLATLRSSTGGYSAPGDACQSWRLLYRTLSELEADLHMHIHKENNVLYPMVREREEQLARNRR